MSEEDKNIQNWIWKTRKKWDGWYQILRDTSNFIFPKRAIFMIEKYRTFHWKGKAKPLEDFFLQSPSENHLEDDESNSDFAMDSAKDDITEDITEETANSRK